MKNFHFASLKANVLQKFDILLDEARNYLAEISKDHKIELQVDIAIIDPFGDDGGELSNVISIENGNIELENGTVAKVVDVTNLTDLIGLIDVIDE